VSFAGVAKQIEIAICKFEETSTILRRQLGPALPVPRVGLLIFAPGVVEQGE